MSGEVNKPIKDEVLQRTFSLGPSTLFAGVPGVTSSFSVSVRQS